jgi:plastocyanin
MDSWMKWRLVTLGVIVLASGGCARPETEVAPVEAGGQGDADPGAGAAEETPAKVDPRQGGFEVGFGEYAVTLEAPAIRPGPVTFVVHNGGAEVHGFEMELEGEDSSGPGSGDDGFKIERPTFGPGETIRVRLDLAPGVYKVECFVANHDDLGMEALLEARPGAPLVRQGAAEDGSFDSGPREQDATFSATVDGSVTYVCAIHPTMRGAIEVA